MKYRKKPVIIDAEPYRRGLEDGILVIVENMEGEKLPDVIFRNSENKTAFEKLENFRCSYEKEFILVEIKPFIDTLEGKHFVTPTDMIITGIKGERYPCKKDIFDMTYEKVE